MQPCEVHEFETGKVEIHFDPDPESPRDWDNLGIMTCWHRRYNLGDKHKHNDSANFFWDLATDIHRDFPWRDDVDWIDGMWEDRRMQIVEKHFAILPLYLYDHSGLSISTGAFSCPWDSGQVGWIHMSLEKARQIGYKAGEEWKTVPADAGWDFPIPGIERKHRFPLRTITETKDGTLRDLAIRALEGEVETYDAYLTGQVFGFVVKDEDDNELESCWGFYSEKEALEEGKSRLPTSDINRSFDLAEAALQ